MNENFLAIAIACLALVSSFLFPDGGEIIKLVVVAYLGFLTGKRMNISSRRK